MTDKVFIEKAVAQYTASLKERSDNDRYREMFEDIAIAAFKGGLRVALVAKKEEKEEILDRIYTAQCGLSSDTSAIYNELGEIIVEYTTAGEAMEQAKAKLKELNNG